ncbi:HAD-IA family hydrolase [Streptomyces sp. SID8379]|uniref:HAD family hydrolase n=1 Tax=unclassified Streptomyces TaxID=2593676 RepID=UPI00036E7E4D|nr:MULTISPECIES: HAD-IA family hydrolase [unclassified Streptomyces]MYW63060.1 HAD-IA family hydrolase [Streptomyces sp. SID8379]
MTIKAVLFDFSGTLFRIESTESWLRAALAATELTLPDDEFGRAAARLDEVGALPGGAPHHIEAPAHLAELMAVRDVDAERHRAAYTGLAREVPLPDERLYDALYERHMTPAAWRPYPDALDVLSALGERGVPVGIVSNIGWDLRPVFVEHGLDPYVDTYVMSYRHGVQKPDARLFTAACEALGVAPGDTLMVGDDRRADAGAAAVGCALHFVDHLPVTQRPDGLRPLLDLI